MPALIPPQIIDLLLLGAPNRRRQLQDLPILGDVWTYLADARSADPPDLLIIPNRDRSAAQVADLLYAPGEYHNMTIGGGSETEVGPRSVAYLNGLVVATLSFDDLVEHVLPFTVWWDRIEKSPNRSKWADGAIQTWIEVEIRNLLAEADSPVLPRPVAEVGQQAPDGPSQQVARLGLLLGVFAAADVHMQAFVERGSPDWMSLQLDPPRLLKAFVDYVELERIIGLGSQCIHRITDRYKKVPKKSAAECHGAIFQVTLNRAAELAVVRSVPAIKGDAARSLFSISCERLGWAVLDSGIDHEHQAFLDQKKTQQLIMEAADLKAEPKAGHPHRIRAAFEFKRIRAILGVKTPEVAAMAIEISQQNGLPQVEANTRLQKIIDDRLARLPVDWRNIEPLIQLDLANPAANRPTHPHGTHVAGIIGADWQVRNDSTRNFDVKMQGVCPDIGLYDFRVLGSSLGDSEFAVSAALQFIRYYNEQVGFQRIHGVNMSLAIRHNVRNYACGQTPVCVQAEALVASGVVVVAAAGNRGYQKYQLEDNSTFEGYASSSITDPGNADGVITVGATHRSWPHTYGVSFFSSRGPTGDGRLKPDLLAPGEKIESCIPGGGQDVMDGTSMAAPHVSGAAALLMARHEELKGRPDRIKEILCETATDLKRERHFQGYGMVDVLRAIQSI